MTMKLLRIIHNQGLAAPVLALLLASFILTLLVAYRIVAGCQVRHAYLVWNLFLAWMPLLFAVLAAQRFDTGSGRLDRGLLALSTAWLLFFPNAPYIFTDLVHVLATWRHTFWSELMLILLGAMTGFLAGFLSLQLMHRLVARQWGRVAGWVFVGAVSGLSAFGVYLGRFVRLNSWDVLVNPIELAKGASLGALNLVTHWPHTKFLILFTLFLLLAYTMLFALTLRSTAGDDVGSLALKDARAGRS